MNQPINEQTHRKINRHMQISNTTMLMYLFFYCYIFFFYFFFYKILLHITHWCTSTELCIFLFIHLLIFGHIIFLLLYFLAENKTPETSSKQQANLSPKNKTYITRKHLADKNIMKSRETIYCVPYQETGSWHVNNTDGTPPYKPWWNSAGKKMKSRYVPQQTMCLRHHA